MIDLNKGVVYKMVPESRIRVYMYAQQPGVYLDAFGNQLSEVFAKQAGFDTDTLRTERTRQTRMAEALAAINSEFEVPEDGGSAIYKKGAFSVIALGMGRHNIVDEEGNVLNDIPLTEDEAKKTVGHLVKFEKEDDHGAAQA